MATIYTAYEGHDDRVSYVAKPILAVFAASVLSLICHASVFAAASNVVLFNNGDPDFQRSHVSDTDQPFQQAGDFVLAPGANKITAVRFYGSYGSTLGVIPTAPLPFDDFTIRFFEDDGGRPAVDWLHEFHVGDIHRESIGFRPQPPRFEQFVHEVQIPEVELPAEQTYWLSIVNSTEYDDRLNWFWARASVGGYWQNRVTDGEEWDHPRLSDGSIHYYESAFQLLGVPEPGSATLAGCGAALFSGVTYRSRWQRRQ